MARTFNEHLRAAAYDRGQLTNAENIRRTLLARLANNQNINQEELERANRDIIRYRGRYISSLRQAYRINPTASIPPAVTGQASNVRLDLEIQNQLAEHQNQINARLRHNKATSNINKPTLCNELKLKIDRLKATIQQYQQGRSTGRDITRASFGIAGTLLKAPVMATAKVASKLGPLAITIAALPITLLASLLAVTFDISERRSTHKNYNNTPVHQMSDALKDGVRRVSNSIYQATGRI